MKKVAIYVRVSTLEQAEKGYSITEQTERLQKYAEIKDWTVYDTFVDGGFSGASLERPALQKLISEVDNYNGVLVYKLDRLSRSQKDTLHLIEDVFNKNNVSFISLNENLDTSTAFGKAMIGILSVFAQLEREQIAERMAMGKIGRAKSGKATSWTDKTRPYGYVVKNDIYQIVPHESKIVKDIFKSYLSGSSISGIASDFSEKMIDGKVWHYSTISRILQNPTYVGKVRFKEKVYPGKHEKIISEEVFEQTQTKIDNEKIKHYEKHNKTRPFQSKYILSGLLKCGKCGSPLAISYSAKRADGTRNMYYKCRSRVKAYRNKRGIKKACGDDIYQKDHLESVVLNEIKAISLDKNVSPILQKTDEVMTVSDYQKEITMLGKQRERLTDLYVDGLIDRDAFIRRQEKISNKEEYFNTEIKTIEEKKHEKKTKNNLMDLVNYFAEKVDVMPDKKKKSIINELIRSITVDPLNISIEWSFAE